MILQPQAVRAALTTHLSRLNITLADDDLNAITNAVLRTDGHRHHFPRHQGSPLNIREIGILEGCARGLTNAQIGAEIGLSDGTVKSHLTRIGRRIGCGDRAGMVGIAYRKGWLRVVAPRKRVRFELTWEQDQVLQRIAFGEKAADMATHLYMSEEGIKSRLSTLYDRLGATNKAHAVAIAYQNGLLPIGAQQEVAA